MSDKNIPKRIEVIARGLATRGSRVLLCRNTAHGYAYLPGGHVEPGEPAAAALAREFLEETGLTVRVGPFLLANENLFTQDSKTRHEINFVFHVEHGAGSWSNTIPSLEPDLAFEWVEVASLPEAALVPPAMLAWLLAGQVEPRDGAWVSHGAGVE